MFLCSFLFLLHRDGVNEDRQGQKDPNTLSWRATLLPPLCLHYGKSMLGKNTEHLSHIYSLALWAGKQHDGWHENFLEAPPFSLSSPFCHLTSLTHQQTVIRPTHVLTAIPLPSSSEQPCNLLQSQGNLRAFGRTQLFSFQLSVSLPAARMNISGISVSIGPCPFSGQVIAAQKQLNWHLEEQIYLTGVNSCSSPI